MATVLCQTSWVFGSTALHRLRGTSGTRLANVVLGCAAHVAARAETWALDLQSRIDGPDVGRPLSPEARRLVEGYPAAYSFTANAFASPERRTEVERAMKDVTSG